jgi:hypothetical protein
VCRQIETSHQADSKPAPFPKTERDAAPKILSSLRVPHPPAFLRRFRRLCCPCWFRRFGRGS